ncbi:cell surface protein [Xylariaceae sp. FL1272]|nr:cell surface protein [Xylariaceae sp. FL1272]
MRYSLIAAASGFLTTVSGHGLVTSIQGANGVTMPGLSVADGVPRDCITPTCGAEADTSIIRDQELGTSKASALGRTQGGGPVDASTMIAAFMGEGAASGDATEKKRSSFSVRGFLDGLTGGGDNEGTKSEAAAETIVAESAGQGATSGLPTCADDGSITMTFRQINQDGAGPLTADVDGTSGGTDPDAFQTAEVTQDVPGLPVGGLSAATNTDFPVTVQMPAGMTCDGTVGNTQNVCIVRVRNAALAGPFGGSAAFTQSAAAKKRAVEYRLKKRSEEQNRKMR